MPTYTLPNDILNTLVRGKALTVVVDEDGERVFALDGLKVWNLERGPGNPVALSSANAPHALVAGRTYKVTADATFNVTVPANPAAGDRIEIIPVGGDLSDNNILIRNSGNTATLFTMAVDGTGSELVYTGTAWTRHAKLWS